MGMPVRITGADAAADEVFAWLRWVDATFSTYRADSEICRLERGELALADAHPLVREVLGQCERLRERTGGFFNLRAAGRLDPSGLVKGWAVDRAAALLDRAGCTRFCIDAGGDLRLRGGPWRVGIRHPHRRRRLAGVIAVTDAAVATSGTYERGRHIVDPHTGRPATDALSVTIVGPDLGDRRRVRDRGVRDGRGRAALDRRPRRLRRDDDPARRSRALHARIRRAAELDDRFRGRRARMVAYRIRPTRPVPRAIGTVASLVTKSLADSVGADPAPRDAPRRVRGSRNRSSH